MFDLGGFAAGIIAAQEIAKIESARWAALTPDQQDRELRKREVVALERQARALENTRRDVHHHFFS